MQKTPLRTQVANTLKDEIAQEIWKVGTKLPSEIKLCKRFSVSRITIRSALQQLEAIGLIETKKGGGTIVLKNNATPSLFSENTDWNSSFERKNIIDILQYRLIVEKGTIAITASIIKDYQIKLLEENYTRMVQDVYNPVQFSKDDYQFHKLIAQFSGNSILFEVNHMIERSLEKTMGHIVNLLGFSIGIHYHFLILQALKDKDVQKSEQLMEEHIQKTIDGIEGYFKVADSTKLMRHLMNE